MVPVILLVLVAVVLVAAVLGVASGRLPADPLADPVGSTPDTGLPEVPTAADVDAVRFDTALRGYRMDEVDSRLDELHEVLAQREVELAQLQAERPTIEPGMAEPDTIEQEPAVPDTIEQEPAVPDTAERPLAGQPRTVRSLTGRPAVEPATAASEAG